MKISNYTTQFLLTALFSIVLASCSGGSDSNTSKPNPDPNPPASTFPALEVSPLTEFDFGTSILGNNPAPLTVTISNTASNPGNPALLKISSISLSDVNNFALNENGGSTPCGKLSPELAEGKSCTVEIIFQPTGIDPLTATLTIESNDPNNTTAQLTLLGSSDRDVTQLNVKINQVEADNCPSGAPLQMAAIVSVTDQAAFPVTGLTTSDFVALENASSVVISSIDTAASAIEPLFLSILMDYSQSMNPIDLAAMEAEVIKMVNQLNPTDKAEIIKFTKFTYTFDSKTMKFVIDDPTTDKDNFDSFTSDTALLETAIKLNVADVSGTAYYDAIELGINDVKIAEDANELLNPRKAVILITDGVDTDSVQFNLTGVILNANINEVPVYVAGIGAGGNSNDLKKLANETSAFFYKADVSENLATIFQQQLAALLFSDQYVVRYDSASSAGSNINVEVTAFKAGATNGTHARPTKLCPPPLK